MARRLVSLLSVALIAGALACPSLALADGDPASDSLLGRNVFYPYLQPTAKPLQAALDGETAAAAKRGFPLKVALIGAPVDLGAIPELFGRPAAYASFLEKEIAFNGPQPLLVVMAAGYGTSAVPARVRAAAAALPLPAGRSDDALARAAIVAVRRLTAADGRPIPAAAADAPSSGASGPGSVIILLIVIVIAALAAAGILLRRHRAG